MLGFRKKALSQVAVSVQTRPEEAFHLARGAPPGPG